ncbi:unnamed protein product [Caretta caretta]
MNWKWTHLLVKFTRPRLAAFYSLETGFPQPCREHPKFQKKPREMGKEEKGIQEDRLILNNYDTSALTKEEEGGENPMTE